MLEENLKNINKQIAETLREDPSRAEPTVLAVSKKQPIEKIRALVQLGMKDFGENYLQEALQKKEELSDLPIHWHFIGQLQSKKIKDIVGEFELIQTVSRSVEVEKISQVAQQKNCSQKILIQVNIAGEDSKQGVAPEKLESLVRLCLQAPGVVLQGLMFFPPLSEDSVETLDWFERCAHLFYKCQKQNPPCFRTLSMGTSQDFPLAIRKGATMVRLGESLMGPRS